MDAGVFTYLFIYARETVMAETPNTAEFGDKGNTVAGLVSISGRGNGSLDFGADGCADRNRGHYSTSGIRVRVPSGSL